MTVETTPVPEVVGREADLAALGQWLEAARGVRAFVVVGVPGIGKTTLWAAGQAVARQRGTRVLAARATSAEISLSFAGLADLLEGVEASVLASLPGPQRRALDVALLREEPADAPPEMRAIATGLTGVLRGLAAAGPLLVAVDDEDSLDAASAGTLAFAARRLADDRVRFLFARRAGGAPVLERAFGPGEVIRHELRELSFGAIRQVLTSLADRRLTRAGLREVFRLSGGNPLFALELGHALEARGSPPGDGVPLPDELDRVVGARVARLPRPARSALLAVALSPDLRLGQLAAVAGPDALADALDGGLLVADGDRVRAAHPLLAAAVRAQVPARERRRLHGELAAVAGHDTARALHRALATVAPDDALAGVLAAAAAEAVARGAIRDAVELAGHALRLTPSGAPDRPARILGLAECLVMAGDERRLTELLEDGLPELPAGEARARAHLLLGEAADLAGHEDRLERALAEAPRVAAVRATVLATRARLLASVHVERLAEAEASAAEALPIARQAGIEDEWRVVWALAWARILRGRPVDDLRGPGPGGPGGRILHRASVDRLAAARLAFRGQVHEARALMRALRQQAEDRGEGRLLRELHVQLCELELRAGDASAAARMLGAWDEWVTLAGTGYEDWARDRCLALLAAVRGQPGEVERWAAPAIARAEARGEGAELLGALRAAGIAAGLAHEPGRAAEALGRVWEHTLREGVDDPGAYPVAGDLVEALVELGHLGRARAVNQRLGALADAQAHPWARATAARGEALLALASGGAESALGRLAGAAAAYEQLGLRFDHARTLLAAGRAARRLRKWSAARDLLDGAARAFDATGGHGWAGEARAELARVGGRQPQAGGGLTQAQREAAGLAAGGLTNKEIAAAMVVSVATVETHLKHAYAKLGVRTRAELALHLLHLEPVAVP